MGPGSDDSIDESVDREPVAGPSTRDASTSTATPSLTPRQSRTQQVISTYSFLMMQNVESTTSYRLHHTYSVAY